MSGFSQIIPSEVYDEKLALLARTTDEMRREAATIFSGPSIDLHRWALDAREQFDLKTGGPRQVGFYRAIYAVLPAWGMHRMGVSRTRMPDFETFWRGLEAAWPAVKCLWRASAPLLSDQWTLLEAAYKSISARAERSGSQIVSRSKVLTHLLPNICAPIDREYTLAFFGVRTPHQHRLREWEDYEWRLYRELHEKFFHVAPSDPRCQPLLDALVENDDFSTSPMKAIDNLIVANT